MRQTIQATYDGKVLRPDKPLALNPSTRVRLSVVVLPAETKKQTQAYSFFEFAKSANIEGPKDWSEHIHDYLYHSENKR